VLPVVIILPPIALRNLGILDALAPQTYAKVTLTPLDAQERAALAVPLLAVPHAMQHLSPLAATVMEGMHLSPRSAHLALILVNLIILILRLLLLAALRVAI